MIGDILEEITEEDIKILQFVRNNVINARGCNDLRGLNISNAINKMLIVYEDYKALRLQREKLKGYLVNELIEINKHQYARGSQRLKKCLHILEDFNDNIYRDY